MSMGTGSRPSMKGAAISGSTAPSASPMATPSAASPPTSVR